jgi:hypothetical protein
VVKYRIPVVVHVIRQNNGTTGNVSMALVQSQIEILNEDFLALAGTLGEDGTDVQIEFYLATTDPGGNPTTGVTYSNNTTWYNDQGSYWSQHLYEHGGRKPGIRTQPAARRAGWLDVGSCGDLLVDLRAERALRSAL